MLLRESVVKFVYTDSFIVDAAQPNQFANPTFIHQVFRANCPSQVYLKSQGSWLSQTNALTTCPGVFDWVADSNGDGGKYREASCFASNIIVTCMPQDNGSETIQEICKLVVHMGTKDSDWDANYTVGNGTDAHSRMPLTMTRFVRSSTHQDYRGATLKMSYAFRKLNAGRTKVNNIFYNNQTPSEKDYFYIGLLPTNVTDYVSNTRKTPKCLVNVKIEYLVKLTEPQADTQGLLGEAAIVSRKRKRVF